MRFHLLGLANVPTRSEFVTDGFSIFIIKLAKMLKAMKHTVIFYGGEGSQVECDEFVQCVSSADHLRVYGDYDWQHDFYKGSGGDEIHQIFNANAIREINQRKELHDFLLCEGGDFHRPIADGTDLMAVEPGVGYIGVFSKYRVFQSYAWMHYIYGLRKEWDGSWQDAVIPNFFEPSEFPFQPIKEDYFLFVGRHTPRKGIEVAVQVTREIGAKLIVTGQGRWDFSNEPHVESRGVVSDAERNDLMGRARAVIMPTYYIEPFGNVAIEAMLCGTPVLTTDWGAFPETIRDGVTGFRCRTFQEFIDAAGKSREIDPAQCRQWAADNFSTESAMPKYQRYFNQLDALWGDGWYQKTQ